jgi:hypothetical protein
MEQSAPCEEVGVRREGDTFSSLHFLKKKEVKKKQNISGRIPGLRNSGDFFIFWGRFGLCRIFDGKLPELWVFKFPRSVENMKILGLVAGVEKSDHCRPTMNKSDRSTLGSKMGDQWSTIGRPLVAHYWSTKVDQE